MLTRATRNCARTIPYCADPESTAEKVPRDGHAIINSQHSHDDVRGKSDLMLALDAFYLTLLLASIVIALVFVWMSWPRRAQPGAIPMMLLCLALAVLAIGSVMEALAPTVGSKETWVNVQYFGYSLSPVFYFLTAMHYLGNTQWTTTRRIIPFLCVPILTMLFTWTNGAHHLMRDHQHLELAGSLSFLGKSCGPWWWVHVMYSLSLMIASIFALHMSSQQSPPAHRSPIRLLILGLLIPLISVILFVCNVSPAMGMDLTPALAVFSTALVGLGIFHLRLFDITPIACAHVIESMRDGMLVLDPQFRIVSMNAACAKIFSLHPKAALGQIVTDVLADYPEILPSLNGDINTGCSEFTLADGNGTRYWEVHLSQIYQRKRLTGRVVLMH